MSMTICKIVASGIRAISSESVLNAKEKFPKKFVPLRSLRDPTPHKLPNARIPGPIIVDTEMKQSKYTPYATES